MVQLLRLATLLALPVASLAGFSDLQGAGESVVKGLLSKVLRFNSTQVERVMKPSTLEPHPFVFDLTDENWETVLRTGSTNPLGASLPDDTTWVISVYGPDIVSKMLMNATNGVAMYNSSESGGTLPSSMKFARINYATETILPTRMWLWKVPIMVIATKEMRELRFFKIGLIAPFLVPMSETLANEANWSRMPPWTGRLAPGGSLEPYLIHLSNAWSVFHRYLSKIPTFILLIASGAIMNIVVGFFHKDDAQATALPVLTREEQRAALKAKWAAEAESKGTEGTGAVTEVKETEGSAAVKPKKKASKRK